MRLRDEISPIRKGPPSKLSEAVRRRDVIDVVKDQINAYAAGGIVRPKKLVKGSAAAKKYMAALRAMRK